MKLPVIFLVLLILSLSTIITSAEPSDISEFPDSRIAFVSELKTRNDELRTCKERKECIFLMEYTKVLRIHIETLSDETKELSYIEKAYGKGIYDLIMENRDIIDLKFDEHFTAGILRNTGGKMLSENNGFSKEEMRKIYEGYVMNEALPALLEQIKKAKSPRMKALYSYGIDFLFSDVRMLSVPMK